MQITGNTDSDTSGVNRLGKYELIARIGVGGMAEVFLARQRGPMNFEKVVVVKRIHPHLSTDKGHIDMLLDEARIAARLKHPNVVDIYDLGIEGGTYFIAMEHLAGEPLLSLLRVGKQKKPLDVQSTARLIANVAEGLDAAHELTDSHGEPLELVHRDVSPGNIIVLYTGQVKIVDFGIAKARGRVVETETKRVKGKLGYVSPEQVQDEPLDRRSDVFSLGIVMWEALTLRRLFRATSMAATVNAVMRKPIRKPSSYRPGIAPELDDICLRALARKPAQRFRTAGEMQAALEDYLAGVGARGERKKIAAYMNKMFATEKRAREELLRRVAVATSEIEVENPHDSDDCDFEEGEPIGRASSLSEADAEVARAHAMAIRGVAEASGRAMSVSDVAGRAPSSSDVHAEANRRASSADLAAEAVRAGDGDARATTGPPVALNTVRLPDTSAGAQGRWRLAAAIAGVVALLVIIAVTVGGGGEPGESVAAGMMPDGIERSGAQSAPRDSTGDSAADSSGGSAGDPAGDPSGTAGQTGEATGEAGEMGKATGEAGEATDQTGEATGQTTSETGETTGETDQTTGDPAGNPGDAAKPASPPKVHRPPRDPPRKPPRPRKPSGDEAQALYDAGIKLFVGGKLGEARSRFRAALKAKPGYAKAYRGLGLVYERSGDKSKAVRAFRTYLRLSPRARDKASINKRITAMGG